MLTKKQQRIITKAGYDLNRVYQLEHSDEILLNVHTPDKCEGRPCTIHNMTDHSMRQFPQHWRGDRGIMERICPHNVGHPDPNSNWPVGSAEWVHGCCHEGCCRPKEVE